MPESLEVPSRFNGPLDSGNGGYSAGIVAGALDGAVAVSLRRPIPLDTRLELVRDGDDQVRLLDGDDVIADGRSAELELDVPDPVSIADARDAATRYRGLADGPFSRCFVCGRAREDAFGVYAGEVDGRQVVASPWTPPAWTADENGQVRPEFVWAVLDCPTYFAAHLGEELTMSVLARLTARVDAPVTAGVEHVVIAWQIAAEGRKREAGAAVLSGGGEVLALAQALMVELRPR